MECLGSGVRGCCRSETVRPPYVASLSTRTRPRTDRPPTDSALKLSKELLALQPSSLALWGAHARLQRMRGKPDDARKVYQTVLSPPSSSAPRAGASASALWWDWAEMEWTAGRADGALQVVLRSAGVDVQAQASGIGVLRAKRHLDDLISTHPAATPNESTSWRAHEAHVKLRALLELLTSSPESALSVLDSALARPAHLPPRTHEHLTLFGLALLHTHTILLRHPSPPLTLRTRAARALARYASNTAVLAIWLETQKGQAVWGRVRALLADGPSVAVRADEDEEGSGQGVRRTEKDLMRRVAEMWIAGCWEEGRWEAEQERVRSGLSGAVQDERCVFAASILRSVLCYRLLTGTECEQDERESDLVEAVCRV